MPDDQQRFKHVMLQ